MKIKLLSLGYCGVQNINFPVEVDAVIEEWYGEQLYAISTEEIVRIGGDPDMFQQDDTYPLVEDEFELLPDEIKVKVRLLTDGLYQSMRTVPLGTIFEASIFHGPFMSLVEIKREDLIAAGADGDYFTAHSLSFFVGSEVEILEETEND